jgi:1-acyl-sn-glycerol-3-phosphate acyltransferase
LPFIEHCQRRPEARGTGKVMSDLFYNLVWTAGWPVFWLTSEPTVIGVHHTARRDGFIVAANHRSPFDVPLLMRHTHRPLDFVSITEVFAVPVVGWFYGHMNAFPLDRSRRDSLTVRIILDRLARGRVVAMFPEGRIRRPGETVFDGAPLRSGVGRLAAMAGVPVVPAVLINTPAYLQWQNWLPINTIRYGIAYGRPLWPRKELETAEAGKELESRLVAAMGELNRQLMAAMRQ